jgi:hypothetical protein
VPYGTSLCLYETWLLKILFAYLAQRTALQPRWCAHTLQHRIRLAFALPFLMQREWWLECSHTGSRWHSLFL